MTMVYVDTSVLVALIVPEPHSAAVARWYGRTRSVLVSAAWCVPEFASALGIKQRSAQIDAAQALLAWQRFERLLANDLTLLPLATISISRATSLLRRKSFTWLLRLCMRPHRLFTQLHKLFISQRMQFRHRLFPFSRIQSAR